MSEHVWKMESAGVPYCKRVLRDGEIVGLLDQLSNGTWVLSDTAGRRVSHIPAQRTAQRCFTAAKRYITEKEARDA
ncbi:hypothetical protein [Caulobacter phage KcrB]|nr:hypothetical protein RW_GP034 [Caulobacter phage RW]WCA46338.1 hypothetical protein [Caulobacter phage KcrB]WCD56273.1 hypothetical protein [Caulobacter phage RLK]WNV48065.1 hypothetical protein GB2A_gp033 [Caulobacter phage GB2A]